MIAELVERTAFDSEANSLHWCAHFLANVDRQLPIPWARGVHIAEPARSILIRSLQDFQLGESSEGRHGRARAEAYARRIGDAHYGEAVRLFFAEEGRHAAYLARFLKHAGADVIGHSWTDFVFRRARRLLGLETLLVLLLTAELIGEVYYRAIRSASDCPVLRAICAQLLRDERRHVHFHIERFGFLWAGRTRWSLRIRRTAWRTLLRATLLAVWVKHRRALRLGGYGFRRFRDEARRGLERVFGAIERTGAA